MKQSLRIGFLHPDLGIGGAERWVLDAAQQLLARGHRVTIFTAHYDPEHCFEQTKNDGLDLRVYGDLLPMQVAQRLRAPCAIARMAYLACRLAISPDHFDLVFCDLVSHAIPVLRMLTRARIIFYCHFPDQLLTPPRSGWYQWYRAPIDRLEEVTVGMAHRVLVNSEFTAAVFDKTFTRLREMRPEVLYPGVDIECSGSLTSSATQTGRMQILSLSRYENKKNLGLAIAALAELRDRLPPPVFGRLQLVIAGGFDERLRECLDTFAGLQAQARSLGLEERVLFLHSLDDSQREALLSRSLCIVNTAKYEHFGYVPLEAMAAGRPVVAVNNGGPAETVVDGVTGLLCAATPVAFAEALARLIADPATATQMGRAGRAHVATRFSKAIFGARLQQLVAEECGLSASVMR
jgi:alpha-1,3/alpha-1,6-mannosyltransferase